MGVVHPRCLTLPHSERWVGHSLRGATLQASRNVPLQPSLPCMPAPAASTVQPARHYYDVRSTHLRRAIGIRSASLRQRLSVEPLAVGRHLANHSLSPNILSTVCSRGSSVFTRNGCDGIVCPFSRARAGDDAYQLLCRLVTGCGSTEMLATRPLDQADCATGTQQSETLSV